MQLVNRVGFTSRTCFLLAAAVLSSGCAQSAIRLPLPVPFSPVNGATPIVSNGLLVGMEGAGAIVGPELARGEVRTISFGIGLGNRVGLGLSWPHL